MRVHPIRLEQLWFVIVQGDEAGNPGIQAPVPFVPYVDPPTSSTQPTTEKKGRRKIEIKDVIAQGLIDRAESLQQGTFERNDAHLLDVLKYIRNTADSKNLYGRMVELVVSVYPKFVSGITS